MARINEIRYSMLRGMHVQESAGMLVRSLHKYDLICIKNCPLATNYRGVLSFVISAIPERIGLYRVDEASGEIWLYNKNTVNLEVEEVPTPKDVPVDKTITTITPPLVLQKSKFKCSKVIGKSVGYQPLTIITYNPEDKEQLKQIKSQYPTLLDNVDSMQQFRQQYVHPHKYPNLTRNSKTFSKWGCFLAAYYTVSERKYESESDVKSDWDTLSKKGYLDSRNNSSPEIINYFNTQKATTFRPQQLDKPHVFNNEQNEIQYIAKLGSITLNDFIAQKIAILQSNSAARESININVTDWLASTFEAILIMFAPWQIKKQFATKNNKIANMIKDRAYFPKAKSEFVFRSSNSDDFYTKTNTWLDRIILASLPSGVQIGQFSSLLESELKTILASTLTDDAKQKAIDWLKATANSIYALRHAQESSILEQKHGNSQHVVVAYKRIVDNHIPTFDPRWSACNAAVMQNEETKAIVIAYDFLIGTKEYFEQLASTGSHVIDERYIVKVATYQKAHDSLVQFIQNAETEYIKLATLPAGDQFLHQSQIAALQLLPQIFAEPVLAKSSAQAQGKGYVDKDGTQMSPWIEIDEFEI